MRRGDHLFFVASGIILSALIGAVLRADESCEPFLCPNGQIEPFLGSVGSSSFGTSGVGSLGGSSGYSTTGGMGSSFGLNSYGSCTQSTFNLTSLSNNSCMGGQGYGGENGLMSLNQSFAVFGGY